MPVKEPSTFYISESSTAESFEDAYDDVDEDEAIALAVALATGPMALAAEPTKESVLVVSFGGDGASLYTSGLRLSLSGRLGETLKDEDVDFVLDELELDPPHSATSHPPQSSSPPLPASAASAPTSESEERSLTKP